MPPKPGTIASLTPMRGIAALLVILYHLDSLLRFTHSGLLLRGTGIVARGYLWVDFFFVLSGFILTHVYGRRFNGKLQWREVKDYLSARFARIYPLHFFALSLTVLLDVLIYSKMPAEAGGGGMAAIYDPKVLPFHFLLLISFGLTGMTWNIPAWSIGAEWWTYLLALPLFRPLNRGVSKRTYLVPLFCSAGLWVLISLHPPHNLDITFDYGLLRCLPEFTIGVCLYQFYRSGGCERRLASDRAFFAALLLTGFVLHFPVPGLLSPSVEAPPPPLTPLFDALSPLVFAGLILCAAHNSSGAARFLNTRPLQFLGEISYSFYLMQGTAFTFFFIGINVLRGGRPAGTVGGLPLLGLVTATILFNLLLSSATYRWIEKPARGWLRRKLTPHSPPASVSSRPI